MPKIRGIKPDLWTDENFVELSAYARLLWIGLWNFACDNGHLQDKSKQIKMRILPTDEVNCAELLREIEGQRLIERTDGWITIPKLSHHQKPHKRWFIVCEKPGCEFPEGMTYGYSKRESTVEQPLNNREQPLDNGCSTADVDGDGDVDIDGDGDLLRAGQPDAPGRQLAIVAPEVNAGTLVAEWIDHCDQRPPTRVIGQVSRELKTLLDEGIEPERVRQALAEWNRKGVHPSVLPSVVHEMANKRSRPNSKQQQTNDQFAQAALNMGIIGGNQ